MLSLSSHAHSSTACLLAQDLAAPPVHFPAALNDLLLSTIIVTEDWEALPEAARKEMLQCNDRKELLHLSVHHGLLTEYQAARIKAGTHFGMVLGNYRVLDRIGAGGMAIVFKAEHVNMRNVVAIKVLPLSEGQDRCLQTRFLAEMRAVARLRHPNIVAAMDAGRVASKNPDQPVLWYLVMEYVAGVDLEEVVRERGPLPHRRACNLIHQIASALAETHKYNLVHRDIKPSNILIAAEDQAKLLDFGLSREMGGRLTQPGAVLGTVDFMAPEQAQNASAVDIRADIYGLGGTLYWCLTGHLPFPGDKNLGASLIRRQVQAPPSARRLVPGLPAELDAAVACMMAVRPEDRFATPLAVMQALLPFVQADWTDQAILERGATVMCVRRAAGHRVLLVDDDPSLRAFCKQILGSQGIECHEADTGESAWEMAQQTTFDLILLDVRLPGLAGIELLKRLRSAPPTPHLKIVMTSGATGPDEMAQMLVAGADEYLTKPFSVVQLQSRVQAALRLKDAQDRSTQLNRQLLSVNAELERNLLASHTDLVRSRNALVLALAKLVERRDAINSSHVVRLQRYCRTLAEQAAKLPNFRAAIDIPFLEMLECCAPLHDIGKVALPDHILCKPGILLPDERFVMQAHTTAGAEMLQEIARTHPSALAFLRMAIDITRHHHERFDGEGYPDRLAGEDIPLAARIVGICDVYDALRSRRTYKPALSHTAAFQIMTEASPGQFDPALLQVFAACAPRFDQIFREITQ